LSNPDYLLGKKDKSRATTVPVESADKSSYSTPALGSPTDTEPNPFIGTDPATLASTSHPSQIPGSFAADTPDNRTIEFKEEVRSLEVPVIPIEPISEAEEPKSPKPLELPKPPGPAPSIFTSSKRKPTKMPSINMPVPMSTSAPKWDGTRGKLRDFLYQLAHLLSVAGITSDEDKIKWAISYVSADIRDEWIGFKESTGKDWEKFLDRIAKEYPEVIEEELGSVRQLEELCDRFRPLSIRDDQDFMTFKRRFTVLADKCKTPPSIIHDRELVGLFVGTLDEAFLTHLNMRLSLTGTVKQHSTGTTRREDPYELNSVIEEAEKIVNEKNILRAVKPVNKALIGKKRINVDSRAPVLYTKEEAVTPSKTQVDIDLLYEEIAGIKTMLTTNGKSVRGQLDSVRDLVIRGQQPSGPRSKQNYMSKGNSNGNNNNRSRLTIEGDDRCFYCHETGHRWLECPDLDEDVKNGLITRDGRKLRFSNGNSIPRAEGFSIKECVRKFLPTVLQHLCYGPPELPQDDDEEPDTGEVEESVYDKGNDRIQGKTIEYRSTRPPDLQLVLQQSEKRTKRDVETAQLMEEYYNFVQLRNQKRKQQGF
jgi:hypothetical protein